MQFRQQALSKLQSPEELDLPVRFARPQGWLVLAVSVIVMAAAAFWAVRGHVSSTLGAPAVLTHAQGSYVLQSPVAGQVTEVLADTGQQLPADAPLLKVHTGRGDKVVRSIAAGRVTSLAVTIGAVVSTGTHVATLERVPDAKSPLMAVVYVPAASASTVPADAAVDLSLPSVPRDRYGVLHGHVATIGGSQTKQQITAFLGDAQLAGQLTRDGAPVAVLVRLDRDAATKSGYRWSKDDGPPHAIESMTPAEGSIKLADQRPADWLLP